MKMIKNQIVQIQITDVTAEGLGIGKYEGMAIFVPQTAVGDLIDTKIVKIKKSYAFGIIEKIISESEFRVSTDCPYFHKCGGCVFRHIDYKAELEIKKNRVAQALKRISGIDIPCGGVVGSANPDGYRNKAQFPFSATGEPGFFAPRSHRVIPVENCALLPQEFNDIAKCVSEFLKENQIPVYDESTGTGLFRHLYLRKGAVSGEIMVAPVLNGDFLPLSDNLKSRLISLLGDNLKSFQININKRQTNVILGDKLKVIYGKPYITDTICGVKLRLSPFTFYQVNHDTAEKLYKKIRAYAAPDNKNIVDLYCGAGSIGLSLCDTAKNVIGVEIVPEAVEDARQNAKENGINNAEFICGDAESTAEMLWKQKTKADVVILDPPRKGCEKELLHTVANGFSPEKIVYVSCDPGTLARDIKLLHELGYNAREYTVFDMFPRTAHVETVVLMSRVEK